MAQTTCCGCGRPNARLRVILGIVALAIVTVGRAGAQEVDRDTGAGVTFPGATAELITGAPTIDGQVLDDPIWAAIAPVTGFTQTTPDEGQPASERTEVRIAYSADTLYFGVVCYDGDPLGDHRVGQPARLAADRNRQLSDHPRHVSRPAERVRFWHESVWAGVRRTSHQRRGGQREVRGRRPGRRPGRRRWTPAARHGARFQPQLGWLLGGADPGVRHRVERRVRHSVPDVTIFER